MTDKLKFEINGDELYAALMIVEKFIRGRKPVFGSSASLDILDTVLIEVFPSEAGLKYGVVKLTATDLESTCEVQLKASKVVSGLKVAIPGKSLAKLSRLFEGVVRFTFDAREWKLQASFGRSKTRFKVLDATSAYHVPEIPSGEEPILKFDRFRLEDAIRQSIAPSKNMEEYHDFSNLFFVFNPADREVKFFSTDRVEIAIHTIKQVKFINTSYEYFTGFAIYHKSIEKLLHVLHRSDAAYVELYYIRDIAIFHVPDKFTVAILTNVGAYTKLPDYDKFVTKDHVTRLEIPLSFVQTFLRRAKLFEAGQIEIKSTKTPNEVLLTSIETELGKTSDICIGVVTGAQEFRTMLDPQLLQGMLKVFRYGTTVTLQLKDSISKPVDISVTGQTGTKMLLAPKISINEPKISEDTNA